MFNFFCLPLVQNCASYRFDRVWFFLNRYSVAVMTVIEHVFERIFGYLFCWLILSSVVLLVLLLVLPQVLLRFLFNSCLFFGFSSSKLAVVSLFLLYFVDIY